MHNLYPAISDKISHDKVFEKTDISRSGILIGADLNVVTINILSIVQVNIIGSRTSEPSAVLPYVDMSLQECFR